jgi:putative oxidoreductase
MKMTSVFAPGNNPPLTSLGLLVLRVWLGAGMLCLHGLDKLKHFSDMAGSFPAFLPIGSTGNFVLVVFAEAVCSALLVLGLITRFAALVLAINMSVAFFVAMKGNLTGDKNGELAFIYLAGYVALFLAGPGSFSVDAGLFGKGGKGDKADKK